MTPVNQPKLKAWLDANGRVVSKGSPGASEREIDRFSIGALKGWEMALQDLAVQGIQGLEFRDNVEIECTGKQPSTDSTIKDDMVLFAVKVTR